MCVFFQISSHKWSFQQPFIMNWSVNQQPPSTFGSKDEFKKEKQNKTHSRSPSNPKFSSKEKDDLEEEDSEDEKSKALKTQSQRRRRRGRIWWNRYRFKLWLRFAPSKGKILKSHLLKANGGYPKTQERNNRKKTPPKNANLHPSWMKRKSVRGNGSKKSMCITSKMTTRLFVKWDSIASIY